MASFDNTIPAINHQALRYTCPPTREKRWGRYSRFGIAPESVGNVFLNGRLMPRSAYPIALGYQLTSQVPLAPDVLRNTCVRSGDRLGLFPRAMSAVVV